MKPSKETLIAGAVTFLIVAAVGFALYYSVDNGALRQDLKTSKSESERLLTQKHNLLKDLAKLKADIQGYQGKNNQLTGKVSDLLKQLTQKEEQVNKLNAQKSHMEKDLKKQLAELQEYKGQLEKEVALLNESVTDLRYKNNSLQTSLALLEANNNDLNKRNSFLSASSGNNYGVEALKKNKKLTINSKRTKEIVLGFDVPSSLAQNLTLTVTTPEGVEKSNAYSKEVSYQIITESDPILLASTDGMIDKVSDYQRVALSYKPEKKLTKGTYKIDIYHDRTYLGSTQIKLK